MKKLILLIALLNVTFAMTAAQGCLPVDLTFSELVVKKVVKL